MTEPLQRQQHPMLLLRVDTAEQVDARQLSDQCLFREMRQLIACEHTGDRNAELGEDMAGNPLVVAGQHLHGHAAAGQRLDRIPGAGFRRIEEHGKASEDEIAFVGNRGCS